MNTMAQAVIEEDRAPEEPATDTMGELRAGIDEIDRALLELLTDRCRLARDLGRAKRDADLPLVDPPREAEVVRRAGVTARRRGLDEELVRRICWSVIELSRRTQETHA